MADQTPPSPEQGHRFGKEFTMINVKSAVLGAVAVVGLLSGCQSHDYQISWQSNGMPSHHNPHQQWWSYEFVYFPGQQVYFEPYTERYFWYHNGLWEEGPEVPETVHLIPAEGKVVHLQQVKPYIQHQTVLRWHPNYYGPRPGSVDPYHATPEAIAQSEQRAAIRVATSIEDLMDMSGSMDTPVDVDLTSPSPMTDQASVAEPSFDDASPDVPTLDDEPSLEPEEVVTSVDPGSDIDQ